MIHSFVLVELENDGKVTSLLLFAFDLFPIENIHGVTADDQVVQFAEVFRHLFRVSHACLGGYSRAARVRLVLD